MNCFLRIILVITALFLLAPVSGQDNKARNQKGKTDQSENDTIIYRVLEQINIYPKRGQSMNYKDYARMVVRIRKVYPFAIEAAKELEKYNLKYEEAKSDRERKKYVKMVEKELFAKHEKELKHFTITEGRYLMLLIDRETGNTSYSIIKEVKGGVAAVFWQSIARIFKNNLKDEYDPQYKHFVIEQIVLMIEAEERAKQLKNK